MQLKTSMRIHYTSGQAGGCAPGRRAIVSSPNDRGHKITLLVSMGDWIWRLNATIYTLQPNPAATSLTVRRMDTVDANTTDTYKPTVPMT